MLKLLLSTKRLVFLPFTRYLRIRDILQTLPTERSISKQTRNIRECPSIRNKRACSQVKIILKAWQIFVLLTIELFYCGNDTLCSLVDKSGIIRIRDSEKIQAERSSFVS